MTETKHTITLPALGEHVTEATITRWLVAPGDTVDVETPLLEVATDKVDTEVPSPQAGIVLTLHAAEDEVVDIGAPLATITSVIAAPTPKRPTQAIPPAAAATPPVSPSPPQNDEAANSDTAAAQPSGTAELPAGESGPPGDTKVERLPRIRQTIARRMLESLHTSAQLTTVVEADVTKISRLRSTHKAEFQRAVGAKLSFLPFFAKATIEALLEHPVLGASVNADCTEITYHNNVHLGIAIDGPKGLLVPVIRHADFLSIAELSRGIADAALQVRDGTIRPDSLSGGTFTITNTGSRGALFDTPILNQPQSGILGTGSVVERVVPVRDADDSVGLGIRSMVYLSITYDHRVVDGADAARFLTTIRRRLETGFSDDELFVGVGRAGDEALDEGV